MAQDTEKIWTVGGCLAWTTTYLAEKGIEHARVSAEWLLCAATGFSRIDLYTSYDRPLSAEERSRMHEGVRRRAQGEPLQYITGEAPFRALSLICRPGVLIPRPETELLVDLVLEYLDAEVLGDVAGTRERAALPWNDEVQALAEAEAAAAAEEPAESGGATADERAEAAEDDPAEAPAAQEERVARVLEVGCGTGCISLSLASERPGRVACVATDIDEGPVALARENRARCGVDAVDVDVRLGDLVAPVRADEWGAFDVFVSNPPYIPSQVLAEIPVEVTAHEPALALDGGLDGLDVYRRLLAAAPRMLKPGGLFACELFEDATALAAALAREAGMDEVRIVEDLTRRPRFVLARTPRPATSTAPAYM